MIIGITGAGGMIGSALTNFWKDRYKLIFYTSKINQAGKDHYTRSDDEGKDELTQFIKSADIIVHLAHNLNPADSIINFPAKFGSNISLTQRITLEILKCKSFKHVIYFSSGGTIYDSNINEAIDESCYINPISPYGLEKYTCENLLKMGLNHADSNYKLTILRPANVYGSQLSVHRTQGVIGVWLTRIYNNLPVRVIGNPDIIRDFLYISDLINAIDLIVSNPNSKNLSIYNIGSGVGYSVFDILSMIKNVSNMSVDVIYEDNKYSKYVPLVNILNSNKFRYDFGWSCKVKISDGIKKNWDSIVKNS